MKRVSVVLLEKERKASLLKLREAGLVHIRKKRVSSDRLTDLVKSQHITRFAISILNRYPAGKKTAVPSAPPAADGYADMVSRIIRLQDEKIILQEDLAFTTREMRRVEAWGDFDPRSLNFLKEHGIKLFPYELSPQVFKRLGDNIKLIVVNRKNGVVRALSVGELIPNLNMFPFAAESISDMKKSAEDFRSRIKAIDAELSDLAHHKDLVKKHNVGLLEEIEYETAHVGMETLEDGSSQKLVSWLSGFVPVDKLVALNRLAEENGWALSEEEPVPGDMPPTLLKNKPALRIIQPLFNLLGTIPGYWEYDISLPYMLFFCLFFAMIFGDVGYGLIFLVTSVTLAVFFKKKTGKVNDIIKLIMVLSVCTIGWGCITGAWFAIPHEKLHPALQSLIVPPFNNKGPLAEFPPFLQKIFNLPATIPVDVLKTRWNIQFLCFSIAAVQLISARVLIIRKLLPSLEALSQVGWMVIMLGMYFVVLFLLLKVPLPSFVQYLIGAGVILNWIFSEQKGGNFFKNIGKSLANIFPFFLKIVGCFGDIISYIRLFAVGFAGSLMARTVNLIALPQEGFSLSSFSLGLVLKLFTAVLILAIGHSLNILMSSLSVIVHGIRLNLLEFAGNHLGMEWSGYEYNPFAVRQKK